MLVKFGRIEKPKKIVVEESSATPTFARFVAEPFERVFGHSIGNALRRILLSSLETPGIISIRIEGVPHEFMAIDGIIEDMTNIVLNLKGALLRCLPTEDEHYSRDPKILTSLINVTQSDLDKNDGQVEITLGDIVPEDVFEVVNPELHLFTVTKPMKKQVDLRIGYGRGYVPSERHIIHSKMVDEIAVDTSFSPVKLVNYFVENTRVGQDTDYDRLVLEVTTDGRLSAVEALSFAAQIAIKNFEVFQQINQHDLVFDQVSRENRSDDDELLDKLLLRIDEIELSVRSTNCLASANIDTIAELVCIPEKRMLEFRNFGKKSLNEIKAKLSEMGLNLGMDLSFFSINSDNAKDKVKELSEQRRSTKEKKVNK
jgi:DNA-directed RNA polymerase subunit alpha